MPPALHYEPPQKPAHKRPAVIIGTILGFITLSGAIFAAYYIFFRKPLPNIAIQINKPDSVLLGESFKLTVAYTNASDQVLQDAVVVLTVPEGMAIIGVDPDTRLGQQSAGDLAPQSVGSKTFELLATGGENSVKNVSIALRYRLKDGGPSLEWLAQASVAVGAPAVALNFDVPQNVFAGQAFDVGLAYQNNSQTPFQNARLVLSYPSAFQIQGSSSTTSVGSSNEWDLGTLAPGAQGNVTATGRVAGGQQSFFNLGVHLQVELAGHRYNLGAQNATVGIQSTPLSVAIQVNRKSSYVASLGENLTYSLSYYNNSGFALQNVIVKATLQGEMFNLEMVRGSADFDSVSNTLTWNTANTPRLANVPAREGGTVEFGVVLKREWPILSAEDKDFAVQVDTEIQSLSVPAGITAAETMSRANLTTKLAGQASIASRVYYVDPSGSTQNSGPYPPRVNQPTQYTVYWQVNNYSTDIDNVRLSATLQSGTRMVKAVKSNTGTLPQYDSQTGEVTWNIPSLAAGQGVFGEPAEAVFQVEATPAVNQINQDVPLVGVVTFSARDKFTNMILRGTAPARNSALPDDSQAGGGSSRRVQP